MAARARDFWGDALDLDAVRVVDSSIARTTGRAFVTWNTIHWAGPPPTDPHDPDMRVLMHELAHCWQHQTGRFQLLRGIAEQTLYTMFGWWMARLGLRPLYDPYDFGEAPGLASVDRLQTLRLEAQAAVIERHWVMTTSPEPGDEALRDGLARLCRQAGVGPVAGSAGRGEDTPPP